uniref:Ribosomal protein S8 n=1 Tax=Pteridomonas danica TaxID=38822 RepID=A0A7T1C592_9STRA|nr:ribosomal protein S8 [Pteridomonas danica]QPM99314.1 ribosomal protein S8 [Pteridomonas danica]
MINDIISDLLTRIRNSLKVYAPIVCVPITRLSFSILLILKTQKFINNFKIIKINGISIFLIDLKYIKNNTQSKILKLIRISKLSLRRYINYLKIKPSNLLFTPFNSLGFFIISTSKGIMTHTKAKTLKLGGEILFFIQ